MRINIKINGVMRTFDVDLAKSLLDLLREAGYLSVKEGCREGECGACTIILNNRIVNSCMLLAVQADGAEITTVEGLGTPDNPHPIQEAFVEAGGVQCGFCIPGKILATKYLLDKNPSPTDEEILQALSGNLCRCTGYIKQIDAVKLAAKKIRERGEKGE